MRSIWNFALILTIPASVFSYSANPPNGHTGAPGEGTCRDCHTSFGLNSGPGTLSIETVEEFEPGIAYMVIVALQQAGQTRWGFEFSPLDQGTLALIDPSTTQLDSQGGRAYVKQTTAGTYVGAPAAGWAFTWTAPAQPPDVVTFYASANAADGNGSTSGDYIYTTTLQVPLAQVSADRPLPRERLLSGSPNPVRDRAVITYRVPLSGRVSLGIYDLAGAMIARLVDDPCPAGTWKVSWDAAGAPEGLYLCRLVTAGAAEVHPLVVLK